MATDSIELTVFCVYHKVDHSFIQALAESGLLELQQVNERQLISHDELPRLEKMIRLHRELEIDIAGIEVIVHMLERVEAMQNEIRILRNQLNRYE